MNYKRPYQALRASVSEIEARNPFLEASGKGNTEPAEKKDEYSSSLQLTKRQAWTKNLWTETDQ